MTNIRCSFCERVATVQQATQRFIAGPRSLFVCRECVELFVDTFAGSDPAWFEQLAARHRGIASGRAG